MKEIKNLIFKSVPIKLSHSIESEDGSYKLMGPGVGSELLECEIDPCEIVNEVDEDEEDYGYVGSQE